ncbi:MAG: excinuclease ABC subunit C [Bacteroidetes bacterium]|nr:MAG: excinuclease ABC subunit C [Bacteroidota bacterium]
MRVKRLLVYIVECSDKSYYTGVTNDIDRRLEQHNTGTNASAYTFSRRPVKLVFTEVFDSPLEAIAFEKQIKGWSREKKRALIERNWSRLSELAVCQNETKAKPVNKKVNTSR